MPRRTNSLTQQNERLHKNHSYEFQVASWLMQAGWQLFAPLLDAAHAVDLIASDGPHTYRLQIKSVESQDENQLVLNKWKDGHVDFVIYFAQRSNWGYVCPAFPSNKKRLNDPAHRKFQCNPKDFLKAFHSCEKPAPNPTRLSTFSDSRSAPSPKLDI
jgi:hypothetical protein